MKISEFDYHLPDELIAQDPLVERQRSRMMVADSSANSFKDEAFSDFPNHLRKGDLLVLNDTKVFPARLFGKSETGGKVELFLVDEIGEKVWETLARPAKRLKPGREIFFKDELSAEVIDRTETGRVIVKFDSVSDFETVLDKIGQTPLPPYIKREEGELDKDRERYQTVYAKKRGAIAAPTAGLHFTPEILDEIKSNGVEITNVTLHVGYGTFEPVRVDDLSEHKVMAEKFEISSESAERLNAAKEDSRRIIAVGTTTTRSLESSIGQNGEFAVGEQVADLTITPGYRFQAIDGLLTNFHLPKSSLLVLVSTFGGYEFIMDAYRHAVTEKYRFYSYGDCMFVQ